MIKKLSAEEQDVVKRAIQEVINRLGRDLETRIGVSKSTIVVILQNWPNIDDSVDASDECLIINNTLNDLLYGIGLSDREIQVLMGINRIELEAIYKKWALSRGWNTTGIL